MNLESSNVKQNSMMYLSALLPGQNLEEHILESNARTSPSKDPKDDD